MKEPLPEARALIERAWLENNIEHDYGFPKAGALAFGVLATCLVLCGAELFGPVGAMIGMVANVLVIATASRMKGGPA